MGVGVVSICQVGPSHVSSGCLPSRAAEWQQQCYYQTSAVTDFSFFFKKMKQLSAREDDKKKKSFSFHREKGGSQYNWQT
jgi:hypothetical protein